jgi:hypothetical protein
MYIVAGYSETELSIIIACHRRLRKLYTRDADVTVRAWHRLELFAADMVLIRRTFGFAFPAF